MWLLILKQWQLILLGMALAALTLTWNLYQGAKDATRTCELSSQMALDQAAATRAEMEVRNKESLGKLSRDHAKKLAEAISNARINWGHISLQPQSSVPTCDELPANGACPSDEGRTNTLVDQCAATTVLYNEWRSWASMNGLESKD